jgi:hypothetical protein
VVLAHFDLPRLRKLELRRYGLGADENYGEPWNSQEIPAQSTHGRLGEAALPPTRQGNLSTLELSDPCASPRDIKNLMQWPAHLLSLSMCQIIYKTCTEQYTVDALQEILNVHRDSLQHIQLSRFPSGPIDGIPNFTKFSHLRKLQISQHNLRSQTPHAVSKRLAAPSLRHFRIDFGTGDPYQESPAARDFAAAQVRWLEELVALLKPSGKTTASKLETIFIDFNPSNILWGAPDEFENALWPWDYVEQAVQAVTKYNVILEYCKPAFTRDEWDSMLAAKRKGEDWPPEDDDDDDDEQEYEDEIDDDEDNEDY